MTTIDVDKIEVEALQAAHRAHLALASTFRTLADIEPYCEWANDARHSAWVEEKRAEAVRERLERLGAHAP